MEKTFLPSFSAVQGDMPDCIASQRHFACAGTDNPHAVSSPH